MTSDRKKPGVAFWATVVVVVTLVAYPLSFGVAEWLDGRDWLPEWTVPPLRIAFWPILSLYNNGPEPAREAIYWYVRLWNPRAAGP